VRNRTAHRAIRLLFVSILVLAGQGLGWPASADNVSGAWSTAKAWPMIPVHAVLMPDGRVLTFGSEGGSLYDVWDPSVGPDAGHLTLPNTVGTNLFCSAPLVLPAGAGVFVAGGGPVSDPNNDSRVFDYDNNTLTRYNDLNRGRYYATVTTLMNGHTYIQGGTGGADRPEIREPDGTFRLLDGANTQELSDNYPRNFIAPDGRVFGFDEYGAMYFVDTSGTGSLVGAGRIAGPTGSASSVAMFRPGRIILFGSKSSNATIIDITGAAPVVSATQSLSSIRRWVNATVLADGRVLATGGTTVKNELGGALYGAEIWDPNTGQWTRGADAQVARLYHSTALLLPDASVLVGGGGNPGPLSNYNVEIYYPPYLFDTNGGWAARPVISSSPSYLEINRPFDVQLEAGSQAIQRVVLVKTGAVTHSFNMDQRFVELTFQQQGDQLAVQAPTRATDAPPGYYLLFVINQSGTPSVGRIARIDAAGTPNQNAAPDLANPGSQTGEVAVPVSLQLSASDPDGDVLSFGATGLPPGISIDSATGLISGTPTLIGTYSVLATASDGIDGDSAGFTWTISNVSTSFVLHPPETPGPILAGGEVTLEASASGGTDVLYKWDFDDGTPQTAYTDSPSISHTFANPGIHYVTVTAIDAGGIEQETTVVVTVHLPLTANRPSVSGNLAVEDRAGSTDRLWVVNQDNDSVSVIDLATNNRIAEIAVGNGPRALAIVPNGEVWITNKLGSSISVVDPAALAPLRTIAMPAGSQPFGIASAPSGATVYVVLEGLGRLLKIDTGNDTTIDSLEVGPNPRGISVSGDGDVIYVSRFITRPLPGESTRTVVTEIDGERLGGEVVVVNAATLSRQGTITLGYSDKPDFAVQGRGVPNYLGSVAISPDGQSAWVPSKQDNIARGQLRDGRPLNSENTVRAISSRIDLAVGREDYAARIDHDDSGVANAIVYDRIGVYMFVALETSRQVGVVDAHGGWEMFRFNTGRAPQGLALSADGRTLYVSNFMDRTVSAFDLSVLLDEGIADVPLVATVSSVASDRLSAQVLLGKRLFYDAKDTRLSRDGYLSCASCHNDGGQDGRVWDLTGFGEGLRNTVSLRGRAGGQGFLHWSNNFDEVQDFEGQIRAFAGGTGLMTNAQFNAGTRSQPLGDPKAGISSDLDALAAYVASLGAFPPSPYRNADGSLTVAGVAGRSLFISKNCSSCHGSAAFSNSGNNNPQDVGTITADSGNRLGASLTGIDIPTLRDAWTTAPYLHRGSAATIADAIRAHSAVSVTESEAADLAAYVSQIGDQEPTAPGTPPPPAPNTGTGLVGSYFNNITLAGSAVLQRIERVNFSWGTNAPGAGVNNDQFSVRWTGKVEANSTGNFQFQTESNDGVRLWVNGVLVIDNWTNHATIKNTTGSIALTKNVRYPVTMEFYDDTGAAVARLRWKRPADADFTAIPAGRLYSN
jgi:YVTN family beta-propeller protein